MQKAVIIYNDRVNTFRRMKEIDAVIDNQPTAARVKNLAELRNRNLICFAELESYNKTGKWLNRHPLLKHFSLHAQMTRLLRENPAAFLDEYSNVSYNVNRYRSYLNNEKRSEKQHEKDRKNLKKHQEREKLMKEVLDELNK